MWNHSDWENMAADMLDRLGVRYARQQHVEGFKVDFVLVGLNIILEVDDPSHFHYLKQRKDKEQDARTKLIGFTTIRIKTRDLQDTDWVIKNLWATIKRARKKYRIKMPELKPTVVREHREPLFRKELPPCPPKSGRGKPRATIIRQCAADGCQARAYKQNPYCPKCTRRYERHGDPSVVLKRGRKAK